MGNAFFVVWRESLEALLVAGILHAWLSANGYGARGRRWLGLGLAAGVGLALLLGSALVLVQDELSGAALDTFQTLMLLVAAALITHMVLWMRRHGRHLKQRLHADLAEAAERSGLLGVALIAALAVAREGAETTIFLYGLARGGELKSLAGGAAAGFAAALATAWIGARGLARINLPLLMRLSAILLLLIASSLLVAAGDRMLGAEWLPPLIEPLWDSSAVLDDNGGAGRLLADFSGYRARPALTTVLLWLGYWSLVLFALRRQERRPHHG